MTDKAMKWLKMGLVVLALAGIAWLIFWVKGIQKDRDTYKRLYTECLNAPADTIVITDTITYTNTDTIYPQPKPWPVANDLPGADTTATKPGPSPQERFYSEKYEKDGFKIHWEAVGDIRWIRFPQYTCPKEISYITKTVQVHDTVTTWKERSHLGVYTALFGNNFTQFPGIEVGGIYTFKGKGGVMVGGLWDSYHNVPMAKIGVFINLN